MAKNTSVALRNEICRVLNERREELGLTLRQIADAVDISLGSASHFANGKYDYKYTVLKKVAEALQMDMVYLAFLVERPSFERDPVMEEVGQLLEKRDKRRRSALQERHAGNSRHKRLSDNI